MCLNDELLFNGNVSKEPKVWTRVKHQRLALISLIALDLGQTMAFDCRKGNKELRGPPWPRFPGFSSCLVSNLFSALFKPTLNETCKMLTLLHPDP